MEKIGDSEINVRRMMRGDIDAVLSLDRIIGKGQSKVSYRDLVVTDPGGPLDFSFVCEHERNMVGFILARLAYIGIPLIGTCIIAAIAIDPAFQKHGIGSKMVNRVLDRCYDEGVTKARALIEEGDDELSRFVQRFSFKRSNIDNYDIDVVLDYLPSGSEMDKVT